MLIPFLPSLPRLPLPHLTEVKWRCFDHHPPEILLGVIRGGGRRGGVDTEGQKVTLNPNKGNIVYFMSSSLPYSKDYNPIFFRH